MIKLVIPLQSVIIKTSFYKIIKFFTNMSKLHLAKGSPRPTIADDGKLRIYSMRFCPYAHRAHLVLDAKKIPHHIVYINLTEKPEWLTEVSALGKVPALHLQNVPDKPLLIESLIIADYLDEAYPENQLHPKNPVAKAADRILVERLSAVSMPFYKAFYASETTIDPDLFNQILIGADIYENELKVRGSKFFGGDKPGMLDYMIWPWFERLLALKVYVGDAFKLDQERLPKIVEWIENMKNDYAVKQFYVTPEVHIKFMEARKSGTPNYNLLA